MKKIFILLLFLYSIQAFSQIKTGGSLELGYQDRTLRLDDSAGNSYRSLWLAKKEFADIHLNVDYKKISLYTDVKTYFETDKFYSYDPFQVEYKVGINYQVNRFVFGATHLCSHGVMEKFHYAGDKSIYECYDAFSVKIILFGDF
jgi:hypothetical protein